MTKNSFVAEVTFKLHEKKKTLAHPPLFSHFTQHRSFPIAK